jgi:hypothetical protein
MSVVFTDYDFCCPSFAERTGSLGAVMTLPCWISIGTKIASTLICLVGFNTPVRQAFRKS